jgi:GntR family transcriptional regulator
MSFNDQVHSWGQTPSSRLLEAGLRPATHDERDALQLLPSQARRPETFPASLSAPLVVSIVRVRLADGTPLAVEHACFDTHLADLLEVDLEGDSLHQALRQRGLYPTLGSSTIAAEAAGPDAPLLAVPENEPLLVETRLIVDQHAAPLEYTVSRYVGSRYALQVTFDVQRSH